MRACPSASSDFNVLCWADIGEKAKTFAVLERAINGNRCAESIRRHTCSPNALDCHPHSNVRRTVAKHDTLAGLEFPKKADNVTIREYQVRQIQYDRTAARDCVERRAEFADVFGVESTADGQHDGSGVSRALNLQQRHDCAERNCRSNRK